LGIPNDATIGLEMDVLPCNFYFRVANALRDANFIDVAERIKHMRSIKSDFELKLVKEASRILDAGISSIPNHIMEGMKEVDLICRLETEMRSMGHQGSLRFRRFNAIVPLGHVMSGPEAAFPSFLASPTGGRGTSLLFPQGAGFRKIRKNEPVLVDAVGIYNGYIADATRIFSIGKLDIQLEDAYDAACQIEESIFEEMQPGKNARDLFELSERMGADLGYKEFLGGPNGNKCGFVGHGLGMELDEYPVLGPLDHTIQSNMTIAVEPKIIYPDKGVLGIEDTFLTTQSDAQRLTNLPREIWQV
jgi:Xaa-Pro aminopeptidase